MGAGSSRWLLELGFGVGRSCCGCGTRTGPETHSQLAMTPGWESRLVVPSAPEPLHLTAGTSDAGPISAPPGEKPHRRPAASVACIASHGCSSLSWSPGLCSFVPCTSASPGAGVCPALHLIYSWLPPQTWVLGCTPPPIASCGAQLRTSESSAGTQGLLTQQALSTSGHHWASPSFPLFSWRRAGPGCRRWAWGCCGEGQRLRSAPPPLPPGACSPPPLFSWCAQWPQQVLWQISRPPPRAPRPRDLCPGSWPPAAS